MDPSIVQKEEDARLVKLVEDYIRQEDHNKAMEVIEDSISVRGIQKLPRALNFLEGSVLFQLGNRNEDIHVENLLIHVWVSMGPSSSSYTLQVSFHNVESQRYISDSLPLPVPKLGPFDVPPLD
ncbi:unnamed protein product [Microthlaspi erraticum]|uniref:DUF627 domain-containing protein n=1 Tax=Microthlaspi erraticum TaxID=1685480 RepID=A0A6D2I068_9BRAS|nr:unnamed protein product [Microthlaspi erraticum]